MKKQTIIAITGVVLVLITGLIIFTKKSSPKPSATVEDAALDLPINTIPLQERPFITLSPDSTGRSLDITLSLAPTEGNLEYELIYNASGKQEGALGSIFLGSEKQPITKSILLGSKSGGGKVTYHEGVTGGSMTITYDTTRLKESWNYLHFDPVDPTLSSTDAKFNVTLQKTALKKDAVVIIMKTFGYDKAGLPAETRVVAGPYGYFTQTPIKGNATVELKLPAGEHVSPSIFGWDGKSWQKLTTKLTGDTLSTTSATNIFLVTAE